MPIFTATLLKYTVQGEKTNWTYIEVPHTIIEALQITSKKSCRVKGTLNEYVLKQVALLPNGNGNFIMVINHAMRKAIYKQVHDTVTVNLALDTSEFVMDEDFISCLADDTNALQHFNTLPPSGQKYFSKWIAAAKTDNTKAKRIHQAIFGLSHQMDYGGVIRYFKNKN